MQRREVALPKPPPSKHTSTWCLVLLRKDFCKSQKLTTRSILPSPPRITARLPQLVFHVTQSLPQLVQLVFLSIDLCLLLLDIAARVLLRHRLLRVRIVFYLGLFQLAPQNIKFFLGLGNLIVCILKPSPPGLLTIRIFFGLFSGLGGFSGLGRAPRHLPRCSSRRPVASTRAEAGAMSDLGPLVLRSSSVITLFGFGASFFASRAFLAASATGSPDCCWEESCGRAGAERAAKPIAGTTRKTFIQNFTRIWSYLPGAAGRPRHSLRCLPASILLLLAPRAAWVA